MTSHQVLDVKNDSSVMASWIHRNNSMWNNDPKSLKEIKFKKKKIVKRIWYKPASVFKPLMLLKVCFELLILITCLKFSCSEKIVSISYLGYPNRSWYKSKNVLSVVKMPRATKMILENKNFIQFVTICIKMWTFSKNWAFHKKYQIIKIFIFKIHSQTELNNWMSKDPSNIQDF